jgi:hypothetical protein
MFMAMQCKTPTMSVEHLGILDDEFYLLSLCQQTIRRLAQNREAARKSRLRKKVNVLSISYLRVKVFNSELSLPGS